MTSIALILLTLFSGHGVASLISTDVPGPTLTAARTELGERVVLPPGDATWLSLRVDAEDELPTAALAGAYAPWLLDALGEVGLELATDIVEVGLYGPAGADPRRLVAYAVLRGSTELDPARLLDAVGRAAGSPLAAAGRARTVSPGHARMGRGPSAVHLRRVLVRSPRGDGAVLFLHGAALANDRHAAPGLEDPLAGLSSLQALARLIPQARRLTTAGWVVAPTGQRVRLILGEGAAMAGDLFARETASRVSLHAVIRLGAGDGGSDVARAWRTYRSARAGAMGIARMLGPTANMLMGLPPRADAASILGQTLDAGVEIRARGGEAELSFSTAHFDASELRALVGHFEDL